MKNCKQSFCQTREDVLFKVLKVQINKAKLLPIAYSLNNFKIF
jgi:hypothetical protein